MEYVLRQLVLVSGYCHGAPAGWYSFLHVTGTQPEEDMDMLMRLASMKGKAQAQAQGKR